MSRFRSETHDGVVHLLWDDGKANSVSSELLLELNEQLDQCERDGAKGLVVVGRPGVFCAGFNLKELGRGGQSTRDLVRGGAELLLRLYGLPIPVVIGCTGHALGMGALLGTLYLFHRPRQSFFLLLATRLLLDLLWWLPFRVANLNLVSAFTGGATVLICFIFISRFHLGRTI